MYFNEIEQEYVDDVDADADVYQARLCEIAAMLDRTPTPEHAKSEVLSEIKTHLMLAEGLISQTITDIKRAIKPGDLRNRWAKQRFRNNTQNRRASISFMYLEEKIEGYPKLSFDSLCEFLAVDHDKIRISCYAYLTPDERQELADKGYVHE
jgi:hypothetical protein